MTTHVRLINTSLDASTYTLIWTPASGTRCMDREPDGGGFVCSLAHGHPGGLHIALRVAGEAADKRTHEVLAWWTTAFTVEQPSTALTQAVIDTIREHVERGTSPAVEVGQQVRVLLTRRAAAAGNYRDHGAAGAVGDIGKVFTVTHLPDSDGELSATGLTDTGYVARWEPVVARQGTDTREQAAAVERAERAEQALADLWAALEREADERQWCSEYDEFAREHGGPERIRKYEVNVECTASPYNRHETDIVLTRLLRNGHASDGNTPIIDAATSVEFEFTVSIQLATTPSNIEDDETRETLVKEAMRAHGFDMNIITIDSVADHSEA